MKRYIVSFRLDNEIEISVMVETEFDFEMERELIVMEARKKLSERRLDQFVNLPCFEVNFMETV